MTTFIALLRGINVGGKTMVPMAELKMVLEKEGLSDVKTLLQSGNVIFRSESKAAALEKQIEKSIAKKFGRAIDCFVRDQAAWERIIAKNPFTQVARGDPGHLVVLCLKTSPTKTALTALKGVIVGREYFEPGDRCLYLMYPDGIGTSKLTNAVLDRHLGTATARNWNTVQKIAALL